MNPTHVTRFEDHIELEFASAEDARAFFAQGEEVSKKFGVPFLMPAYTIIGSHAVVRAVIPQQLDAFMDVWGNIPGRN